MSQLVFRQKHGCDIRAVYLTETHNHRGFPDWNTPVMSQQAEPRPPMMSQTAVYLMDYISDVTAIFLTQTHLWYHSRLPDWNPCGDVTSSYLRGTPLWCHSGCKLLTWHLWHHRSWPDWNPPCGVTAIWLKHFCYISVAYMGWTPETEGPCHFHLLIWWQWGASYSPPESWLSTISLTGVCINK